MHVTHRNWTEFTIQKKACNKFLSRLFRITVTVELQSIADHTVRRTAKTNSVDQVGFQMLINSHFWTRVKLFLRMPAFKSEFIQFLQLRDISSIDKIISTLKSLV